MNVLMKITHDLAVILREWATVFVYFIVATFILLHFFDCCSYFPAIPRTFRDVCIFQFDLSQKIGRPFSNSGLQKPHCLIVCLFFSFFFLQRQVLH